MASDMTMTRLGLVLSAMSRKAQERAELRRHESKDDPLLWDLSHILFAGSSTCLALSQSQEVPINEQTDTNNS